MLDRYSEKLSILLVDWVSVGERSINQTYLKSNQSHQMNVISFHFRGWLPTSLFFSLHKRIPVFCFLPISSFRLYLNCFAYLIPILLPTPLSTAITASVHNCILKRNQKALQPHISPDCSSLLLALF